MDNITRMAYYDAQNKLRGAHRRHRTKPHYAAVPLTHRQLRRVQKKANRLLPRPR